MKLPLFKKSLFEAVKFGISLELLECKFSMKSKISDLLSVKTLTSSALIAILALGTVSCTSSGDKDDDGDGVKNSEDAFPDDASETLDTDEDGIGNNADLDDDGDGISDLIEIELEFDPLDSTSTPVDTDSDGEPDVQDLDDDNDGYSDLIEESESTDSLDVQSIPADNDSDFDPDSTDEDDDNDNVIDTEDAFPFDASETLDNDSDGTGNNADLDDDNDGFSDLIEAEAMTDPFDDQSKPIDTDLDGDPDFSDLDDDNDRYTDTDEIDNGTDPLDKFSKPLDTDKDYVSNLNDDDDDNDGYEDSADAFPVYIGEWLDSDEDGVGDNSDHYPNDANCWSDADGGDVDSDSMDGCDQLEVAIGEINLSELYGHNGFTFEGVDTNHRLGQSISTLGDINHDGFDDYVITERVFGNSFSDPLYHRGKAYFFFGGKDKYPVNIDFNTFVFDGSNGFVMEGVVLQEKIGNRVAELGDINGDHIDDFVIAGEKGESFFIFGKEAGWMATFDHTSMNGENGFVVKGDAVYQNEYSLGDINHDGINDFAFSNNSTMYLFFGQKEDWPAVIDITNPESIVLPFLEINDSNSIAGIGDINNDGIEDLAIKKSFSSEDGRVIIYFGQVDFENIETDVSLVDGGNGIYIYPEIGTIGSSLASGDFNDDGINDVLISTLLVDTEIGRAYLIFGSSDLNSDINVADLNGLNGVELLGESANDRTGLEVRNAGDFNGDGIDDLLISSDFSEINGVTDVGRAVLIFGHSKEWSSTKNIFSLPAEDAIIFNGINEGDYTSNNIDTAGDINGDGFDDILIGAFGSDQFTGKAYVIYGFQQFKPAE